MATASVGAEIAVLAVAARLRGWRATDYLGSYCRAGARPRSNLGVMAFALAYDALTYLLGRDVVTPFQIEAYRNARDDGALLLMLIARDRRPRRRGDHLPRFLVSRVGANAAVRAPAIADRRDLGGHAFAI